MTTATENLTRPLPAGTRVTVHRADGVPDLTGVTGAALAEQPQAGRLRFEVIDPTHHRHGSKWYADQWKAQTEPASAYEPGDKVRVLFDGEDAAYLGLGAGGTMRLEDYRQHVGAIVEVRERASDHALEVRVPEGTVDWRGTFYVGEGQVQRVTPKAEAPEPLGVGDRVKLIGPHTANGGSVYTAEADLGATGVLVDAPGASMHGDARVRWDHRPHRTSLAHPSCLERITDEPAEAPAEKREPQVEDRVRVIVDSPTYGSRASYRVDSIKRGDEGRVTGARDGDGDLRVVFDGPDGGRLRYINADQVELVTGEESAPTPAEGGDAVVAAALARAEAAEAELEEFRQKVRTAVISEARRQGWQRDIEMWLGELGLPSALPDGFPTTEGSIVTLNDDRVARLDSDGDWVVRRADGTGYADYANSYDVAAKLRAVIYTAS
ncbi:hypothetical protein [Kineococcus esterisolvens]|uniref:hypothetical protein n=1 Tax=unclassified Kineococcus TaxID=2621656 RepID=UPI003D7C8534